VCSPAIHSPTLELIPLLTLYSSLSLSLSLLHSLQGDVLCMNSPNKPEYPIILHGACMLGGIVSPTSPQHTAEELAGQLSDSASKFLVTVPALLEVAHEAATLANLPLENIIVVHEETVEGPYSQYADLLPEAASLPAVDIDPLNDCAILPYSSGTTGKPKGVRLSHYNLVSNVLQIAAAEPIAATDTLIAVLPFFHIYGLQLLVSSALHAGATAAVMPVFHLETFLQTLQDYRITGAHVAPPIVVALAKHPVVDRYDLSALRYLFSGAAPLSRELSEAVTARLGCVVRQAYGASEISPAANITPEHHIKEGSVGPLLPNTVAKILCTETGVQLPAEQVGEICIKGPQVMLGYHKREDATADAVRDGFLHTGDTGYVDDEGYFFIVDRLKEILKLRVRLCSGVRCAGFVVRVCCSGCACVFYPCVDGQPATSFNS
jgi:acyl-CoA synthetase (AMP-forming)/AMP-acid ligase II